MRILLTNDDGIHAEGIQALRRVLEKREDAQIFIVAPDRERSGSGHSITFNQPLRVQEVEYTSPKVQGYSVDGTPSDCVKLALKAIMPEPPDVILSGINNGANLGTDVLYSGTVSAAIEGIMSGIPSVALSLTEFGQLDYSYGARFASNMLERMIHHELPPNTLLNVNIPPGKEGDIKGLVVTHLGVRQYEHVFERRTDPFGRTYYWLAGELVEVDHDPKADITAVREGKISVTPIHFDLTHYDIIESLYDWKLESLCFLENEEGEDCEIEPKA
jgi:5'-nucleotidase